MCVIQFFLSIIKLSHYICILNVFIPTKLAIFIVDIESFYSLHNWYSVNLMIEEFMKISNEYIAMHLKRSETTHSMT